MAKEKLVPLHEMACEQRIEAVKEILEHAEVPQKNWSFVSYLMGVAATHAENSGANLEEAEGNVTNDVNVLAQMMKPMITRGFGQSAATEICGLWPMNGDQGKVAYMRNYYTNDSANPVKPVSGKILFVPLTTGFVVGGDIAGQGSGTGKVRYIEDTVMYIEVLTGTFSAGQKIDNAAAYSAEVTTITSIQGPEIGPHVFHDWSTFASLSLGEAAGSDMKEVELGVDLMNVTAEDHKMKLRYTRELGARLKSYYGLDAENLTDNVGAMAFKQELNRRVFYEVLKASDLGGISSWDYDTSSDGRWELEKIKTLMTKLNFESADILQSNYMEPGNYMVVDSITYSFFNSYGFLDMTDVPGKMAQPMKNPFVGILNGTFRCYVNPWLRTRTVSIGMKDFSGGPEAETRAGIFFHPYLALDITKTISTTSGQPIKFLWSMYGFTNHPFSSTTGVNDFFRRVNVTNLPNHV